MQQAMADTPPQTPLEGALNIANDDSAPWKGTFVGEIAAELADTAKIATSPLRNSANNTRDHIQETAPSWVLDNSARFVAGAHIMGELSYMVSGGTLPSPIKINGFGDHGYGSQYKGFFDKEGWKKGLGALKEAFTDGGTIESIAKMPESMQKGPAITAYGKWRTYSALTGLTMFGLSAIFNPPPDSKEEQERMAKKYDENKLGYFTERAGQMFRPDKHARESIGLGMLAVGLFSGICGWRQKQFFEAGIKGVSPGYMKEVYAGMLSGATGLAMIGSVEDSKAWQRFAQIMPMRLFFTLPRSAEVWRDKKDLYYGGGVGMFQLMNAFSFTIGGTSSELNSRHSAYARLAEGYEPLIHDWQQKPLYQNYHEKADEIKATYEQLEDAGDKAAAAHSDAAAVVRGAVNQDAPKPEQKDAPKQKEPSKASPQKERSPKTPDTEVREAQAESRLKKAADKHVA